MSPAIKIPDPLPRLMVMVGLPYSGKTTICEQIVRAETDIGATVIISPDAFRLAIHGSRFQEQAEPFVWAAVYAAVDALRISGHRVIVDGCHGTPRRREPWTKRGAFFMVMKTPLSVCEARARSAGDSQILPTIERMAAEFVYPPGATEQGMTWMWVED